MARTKYYHADEAAEILGISVDEVRVMLGNKELKGHKQNRRWLVDMEQPAFENADDKEPDTEDAETLNQIEQSILEVLRHNDGLLAKEIGEHLFMSRKQVNHYLYGSLTEYVWQDTDYTWHIETEDEQEFEEGSFLTKEEALKKYFGYDSFRQYQGEIIDDVLQGKDVLAILPTGSGKSVCYQIPSVITDGVVIVISPLIALMKDQVDSLTHRGIRAATLNSSKDSEENKEVIERYKQGQIDILYMSPERFQRGLYDYLQEIKITLFAIDEAHCISHWGHDFREEYTCLNIIKKECPDAPILALTATANSDTRADIKYQLCMEDANEYIASFDRENIFIEVRHNCTKEQKLDAIEALYNRFHHAPGIVYCQTQKKAMSYAKCLQERGIAADFYHAGMSTERRNEVQDAFMNDDIKVICATVAFGMGVNKKDIRWVVHANMSNCIENYYQEIGRAGRDGQKCHALMFYSKKDEVLPRLWAEESGQPELARQRLKDIIRFTKILRCRRKFILNYFGEEYDSDRCFNCDNCIE